MTAPEHASRAHASLGASSAFRWMRCPGSVAAAAALQDEPRSTSVAAEEGTAAHELAEWCLRCHAPARLYGRRHIHGVEITDEMRDAVQLYVDTVWTCLRASPLRQLWVEQRVNLAPLRPPTDMFGTADALILDTEAKQLHVIDFKYGQGKYVPIEDNPQLLYYLLGAKFWLEEMGHDIRDGTITIVQPRNHQGDPVRTQEVSAVAIEAFANELVTAARATTLPDAPRHPGAWCQWCRARATCPAAYAQAQDAVQMSFMAEMPTPLSPSALTPEQLQRALELKPVIEGWLKSVQDHATQLARDGALPGWKLVAKRAARKWTNEDAVITALGPRAYEKKLRSVAQVEKDIGKKAMDAFVHLVEKISTGTVLVQDSDRRMAVSAGDVFDVVEATEEDE